jgi:TRAP-type transport system periplasmic protein
MRPKHGFSRGQFIGALGACGTAGPALPARAADTYTMRLSAPTAANSVFGSAGIRFAESVARRSNGQVKIEVYPNGQLATQQAAIDALTNGVVDFAIEATSFLTQLLPRYEVFDMPFLFKDLAAGFRVVDGAIGNELFAELEPKGILGLGWGLNGLKELETTSKPIVVPDDMKGLRIRIQSGGVLAATYQAMGALPITIDYSEIFTSLSQHTVEALDIPIDGVFINKWYTVLRHIAVSDHVTSVAPLLGSKRKIEALPPALQRIVKEEAKRVVPYWRSLFSERNVENMQNLAKVGVAFTKIQFAPFRKAVEPVYAMVQARLGGNLLERINRAANA